MFTSVDSHLHQFHGQGINTYENSYVNDVDRLIRIGGIQGRGCARSLDVLDDDPWSLKKDAGYANLDIRVATQRCSWFCEVDASIFWRLSLQRSCLSPFVTCGLVIGEKQRTTVQCRFISPRKLVVASHNQHSFVPSFSCLVAFSFGTGDFDLKSLFGRGLMTRLVVCVGSK